jgi:hypothetical protein
MSYSEEVLQKIVEIADRDRVNLFEATATFCEEFDIDPEELSASIDQPALDRIKAAAIAGRHVRRCVQEPSATLPF